MSEKLNKLETLVPPLELCKKIPAGEFEDSALVWINTDLKGMTVFVSSKVVMDVLAEKYPAPTLQEIMVELCNYTPYCIKVCESFKEWHIECCIAQEYGERYISADSVANPATAALKLWLKMKGIEA